MRILVAAFVLCISAASAQAPAMAACVCSHDDPPIKATDAAREDVFTQLYSAEMELSKANMDASNAEESLSKSVHRMAVSCGIAAIAALCFLVGAIGILASKKRYRTQWE